MSNDSRSDAPHRNAAFINAIADEGTKAEAVEWLQKTWNEFCQAESRVRHLEAVNSNLADTNIALADQVESLQRSAPPPPTTKPNSERAVEAMNHAAQILEHYGSEGDLIAASDLRAYAASLGKDRP